MHKMEVFIADELVRGALTIMSIISPQLVTTYKFDVLYNMMEGTIAQGYNAR